MEHAKFNRLKKKLPGLKGMEFWYNVKFEPMVKKRGVLIIQEWEWQFVEYLTATGSVKAYEFLKEPNNYFDFIEKNGIKFLECLKYATLGMFSENSKYVPRRLVNQLDQF